MSPFLESAQRQMRSTRARVACGALGVLAGGVALGIRLSRN